MYEAWVLGGHEKVQNASFLYSIMVTIFSQLSYSILTSFYIETPFLD